MIWVSLVIVSFGLIFLNKWVKKEAQTYALVGLVILEISLIMILNIL